MRSFHTYEDGCNLLGLPADLAAELAATSETFRCPNCLAGVQQVGARLGWAVPPRQAWPRTRCRHASAWTQHAAVPCSRRPRSAHLAPPAPAPPQCYVCKREGKESEEVFK